jgi:hypothetical protein
MARTAPSIVLLKEKYLRARTPTSIVLLLKKNNEAILFRVGALISFVF